MLLAASKPCGAAKAVDFNRVCTLKVEPGSGEILEDLFEAQVVVDLYKVADASKVPGQDTYGYSIPEGSSYEMLNLEEITDNAQWKSLAQEAAAIALSGQEPDVEGIETFGGESGELEAGLYLVIARGADEPDYVTAVKSEEEPDEAQGGEGQEAEMLIATIAHSDNYIYTFLPELVSLPGKLPVEGEDGPVYNTSNAGDWIYDMNVVLKPSQSVRYGSLEIEKTLLSYETTNPATFVFSVEAAMGDRIVYSDVVSLSFTEPGSKTALLEKIPVGAQVRAEEIYSGSSYALETDEAVSVVIEAEETASATFINDYDSRRTNGGAVTNHFEYETESGWIWTQIPDRTEE